MPEHAPLYIVTSPRSRVGKTLTARLLFEFLRATGRHAAGYDLNPREPAFAGRFPDQVAIVDIAATRGEMALFDRLIAPAGAAIVVDLGYAALEKFFAVAAEIGFVREAQRRLIQPVVLFVADPMPSTMHAYAELQQKAATASFVPVHNEAAAVMVTPEDYPPRPPDYGMLRIPRLSGTARGLIDRPSFSFAGHLQTPAGGASEIHSWLAAVFADIQALELRLRIGQPTASSGGSGHSVFGLHKR
jgi:hypothetical protein